ncbi:alpha/beta hydrolase [Prochlorococcus sp. MIT 1307]|uniref:alpha/beta hydrolase n=1 Tax=Prochlorococcus sp. MIT 1307 TaxID=3096219 RepID=UPI002A753CAD|nr:alpha/beta hydrolase [Prochlorococcus sp. MIT 1307]
MNLVGLFLGLSMNLLITFPSAKSAEALSLEYGIFSRTISVDSLDYLANTGKAKGTLKNIIKLTNQSEEEISKILNENFELPLVVTTKLMYSSIGKVIILRIAKIIHPKKIKDQSISIPAIRSGVIKGIVMGEGKINLIQFFKSYPNKTIAINIPALFKVLNKVESMSELIEFFSNSPLKGIQSTKTKI